MIFFRIMVVLTHQEGLAHPDMVKLRKVIKRLREEIKRHKKKLKEEARLKKQIKKALENAKKAINELFQHEEELEKQIKELKKQNEELKKQNEDLEFRAVLLDEMEAENKELKKQKEELEAQLFVDQRKVSEHEGQVDLLREILENYHTKQMETMQQNALLRRELDEMKRLQASP